MADVDSKSSQQALDRMLKAIGLKESTYNGKITIRKQDPVLASRHRFGELMAAVATIDGPSGEITYLPTLIECTDIKPGCKRSKQPLGSSIY